MLDLKARLPQVGEEIQISLKSRACRNKEIGDYVCKVFSATQDQVILIGADNILKDYTHISADDIDFEITAEFAFKRFKILGDRIGIPSIKDLIGDGDDIKISPLAYDLIEVGFNYWLMDNASFEEAYYVDAFGHISVTSVHERMGVVPFIKIDLDEGEPLWEQDVFDWFDTINLFPILKENSGSDISRVMDIIQQEYAGMFYKDTGLSAEDYMWYCLLSKDNSDTFRFAKYLAQRYTAVEAEPYESFRILVRR